MPEQQPELPGFSAGDLATINEDRVRRGLPPQPNHWVTADDLREAGSRQRPVKKVLAEMRLRLPLMSHLTSGIRVN